MTKWVALLRGINVGGNHKMPMAELRSLCESLGYLGVKTYIQSGNVVFRTDGEDTDQTAATDLAATLAEAITKKFGFEVPVVVRSADEFSDVATRHPLAEDGDDPKLLHVVFLGDTPDPERVAALDPDRSPPDTFVVDDREVYVRYPDGSATSKVDANWLAKELGVTTTARNWNSIQKILALTAKP